MAGEDDLFLFGENFDAILDALEADEEIQDDFVQGAIEVESQLVECGQCGKKCKSIGGLKRHTTAKHPEVSNEGSTSDCPELLLTPSQMCEFTEKARVKILAKDIYSDKMLQELSDYAFISEYCQGPQFNEVAELFTALCQNRNIEKFYSKFYSAIPLKATHIFPRLSADTATLLSTKVADQMLIYCKLQSGCVDDTPPAKFEVSENQLAGLQYIGGYVLHNLNRKHRNSPKWNTTDHQHAMAVLQACKAEDDEAEDNRLVSCLNRGGLWAIGLHAQALFVGAEEQFQHIAAENHPHCFNFKKVIRQTMADPAVLDSFYSICCKVDCTPSKSLCKDLLQSVIALYVRVRCFSYARDAVQKYKILSKQSKVKGLRKEIKRRSEASKNT